MSPQGGLSFVRSLNSASKREDRCYKHVYDLCAGIHRSGGGLADVQQRQRTAFDMGPTDSCAVRDSQ